MHHPAETTSGLKACSECGCIQRIPSFDSEIRQESRSVRCCRCGAPFKSHADYARMRAKVSALASGALLLFPAAILLPIIQIERFGHHHRSSLIDGIRELFAAGEWSIAFIVFFFSLVFPVFKLVSLMELCWWRWLPGWLRIHLYRWLEVIGKWSMLDVLLLALMVMWIKLSDLVSFQFGPATIAFAACVALSMLASLVFDPQSIWDQVE